MTTTPGDEIVYRTTPGGELWHPTGTPQDEATAVASDSIHQQLGAQIEEVSASVDSAVGEAMAGVLAQAEDAAGRAEAAAASIGSALITTTDPGFEGAVGDAEGRPSWLRYDGQGLPTSYVADALETVGVPHAEDPGDGLTIAGEDGTPTWLSTTGEGGPDDHARTWLANALHCHVGPDEPEVHPGGWIVWTRTDERGTPIETLIGRN